MSATYVLTKAVKKSLEGRGHKLICARCEKPIKVGQEFHSQLCHTVPNKRKSYHEKCWQEIFF